MQLKDGVGGGRGGFGAAPRFSILASRFSRATRGQAARATPYSGGAAELPLVEIVAWATSSQASSSYPTHFPESPQ